MATLNLKFIVGNMSNLIKKIQDIAFLAQTRSKTLQTAHWVWIASSISIATLVLSSLSTTAEANKTQAAAISDSDRITFSIGIPHISNYDQLTDSSDEENDQSNTPLIKTINVKVKSGDSLTRIFDRSGLNAQQVNHITQLGKKGKPLTNLKPGQKLEITVNAENELQKLVYHIDKTHKLFVSKQDDKYVAYNESREFETRTTYAKGVIKTSLFDAANDAGLSDNLTMDLAYIFGWDIDFALDIREGDSFVLTYEELFLDGEKVQNGNILAAEFINQGKSFKAVRYTDENGRSSYYSEKGKSMRKAFLRSPVDFTRISSRFGKRHHPILKKRKSHKGVDYAASRGTPIKAAGDGKIIWRGRKGGYGKTVIIKHANKYSTLYGHMNSYDRKARSGSRVKQGQVIGYVGSTGRATGPHLHYEFRVNGAHRNPLTISLPNAASIPKKFREDFKQKSQPLVAQLDIIKNTNLALSDFQ